MSYADYLELEARSDTKHEYLDGTIWAMAGGTLEHGELAMKVGRLLGNALDGTPCRIYSSDVRVRIADINVAVYPDVSVVCGRVQRAEDDANALVNPVLVVEVLSDSTEAYDRGKKAAYYRSIPSLREYLLVSQTDQRLEVQRRCDDRDAWELVEAGPGHAIELTSVGVTLHVDEVYRVPPDA